jgi:hypothetical protein
VRIRVIMPAIIDQAGRPFNVDEADGIRRRHRRARSRTSAVDAAQEAEPPTAIGAMCW